MSNKEVKLANILLSRILQCQAKNLDIVDPESPASPTALPAGTNMNSQNGDSDFSEDLDLNFIPVTETNTKFDPKIESQTEEVRSRIEVIDLTLSPDPEIKELTDSDVEMVTDSQEWSFMFN